MGYTLPGLIRANSIASWPILGLRKRASRIDVVGAGKEAGRGLGIADLKRGLACADQSVEILGIRGEGANVAGQRIRRSFSLLVAVAILAGHSGSCDG